MDRELRSALILGFQNCHSDTGNVGRSGGDDRTYGMCNISQRIRNHSSSYYEAKSGAK